jgi:dipeptidyl aminopeptidase/acylaminoacyl peptidase
MVPLAMAENMREAMEKAGAEVKLIRVPGGSRDFAGEADGRPDWPDFFSEAVGWMDRHLITQKF